MSFRNPRECKTDAEIERIEKICGGDPETLLSEYEKEINRVFAKEQCRIRRERREKLSGNEAGINQEKK